MLRFVLALPVSLLLCRPELLAGPQVIDKQIMETNNVCLLLPQRHGSTLGRLAPACASTTHVKFSHILDIVTGLLRKKHGYTL